MQLYTVVGGAEAPTAVAVFSTRERALTFIDERGVRNARVEACTVPAQYRYPAEVYAAHVYDSRKGAIVFSELFVDADQAKESAGQDGQVVVLRPDGKAVENIH